MSHSQMFLKSDNAEGFISVIVHRERYLSELKALGWVESVDKLPKAEAPAEIVEPEKKTLSMKKDK